LVIHPALVFQGDVAWQGGRADAIIEIDPRVDYRPAPLLPIGAEISVEILGVMTVVHNQQDRTRRDLGVILQEIGQLSDVDRLEFLFVQIAHQYLERARSDLVIVCWFVARFEDGMEHDDHHDRAGRGVVRVPPGFEILARIGDVGMRRVERIEQRGGKYSRQGRRRTDGSGCGCRGLGS